MTFVEQLFAVAFVATGVALTLAGVAIYAFLAWSDVRADNRALRAEVAELEACVQVFVGDAADQVLEEGP